MLRTLFVQEFGKRLLRDLGLGALLTLLGIVIRSAVTRWFGQDFETDRVFDGLVLMAMLSVAVGTGSSVFSRAFREGPLRLLDVLPVRRSLIWLLRVSSAAASAVGVMALLFLIQPSMLQRGTDETVSLLAGLALLLFVTGCCLSTSMKTPTLATSVIAATVSLGILLVLVVVEHYIANEVRVGFIAGVMMGVLFPPLCLAFSFLAFIRGELDTPRGRWRNAVVGTCLILGILSLAVVSVDAGVIEMRSEWNRLVTAHASYDGAYVSMILTKGKYSPKFRVEVIETSTGRSVKTYEGRGTLGQAWTSDGALLVFSKGSALSYLLNLGLEKFDATRIFPTEQVLLHKRDYMFLAGAADRRGPLVLLQKMELFREPTAHTTLLRMDSSGQAHEALTLQTQRYTSATLTEGFDGSVLSFARRTWLVRENVEEIRQDVGHFRFTSEAEAKSASAYLTNSPRPPSGKYLVGERTLDFNDSIWLYYLQPDSESRFGRLWARRRGDTEWKEVLKDIPLSDRQLRDLSPNTNGLFTSELFRNLRGGARTASSLISQERQIKLDPSYLI